MSARLVDGADPIGGFLARAGDLQEQRKQLQLNAHGRREVKTCAGKRFLGGSNPGANDHRRGLGARRSGCVGFNCAAARKSAGRHTGAAMGKKSTHRRRRSRGRELVTVPVDADGRIILGEGTVDEHGGVMITPATARVVKAMLDGTFRQWKRLPEQVLSGE